MYSTLNPRPKNIVVLGLSAGSTITRFILEFNGDVSLEEIRRLISNAKTSVSLGKVLSTNG